MMKRLASLVLFASAFCLAAPAQAQASGSSAAGPEIISSLTLEGLQQRVQGMGFECTRSKDATGKLDDYFVFRAEGYKVAVFVPHPNIIELDNIFDDIHPSLDAINAWNRDHRFAMAYKDKDGNIFLQDNLDLKGGITAASLQTFITNFRDSVADWAHYAVSQDQKDAPKP